MSYQQNLSKIITLIAISSSIALGVAACGDDTSGAGGSGGAGGASTTTTSSSKAASSSASGSGSSSASSSASSSGSGGAAKLLPMDVQAILTTNCATSLCHSGAMPKQGQDLSPDKAYAALVDVPSNECAATGGRKRVDPGKPESSYIIDKLKGMNLCGMPPAISQMPKGLTPLDAPAIKTIEDWIKNGAKPM